MSNEPTNGVGGGGAPQSEPRDSDREATSPTAAYSAADSAPASPVGPYPPGYGAGQYPPQGQYQPQGYFPPQGQYQPQGQYGSGPQYQQHNDGPGFSDRASHAMSSIGRHVKTPETKEFFKTSEFGVWLVTVVAIVIAGAVIDASSNGDVLRADLVWKLVTAVSAVYILSRGIAKAGTRRGYGDRPMDRT
jgi:hypothetical protein